MGKGKVHRRITIRVCQTTPFIDSQGTEIEDDPAATVKFLGDWEGKIAVGSITTNTRHANRYTKGEPADDLPFPIFGEPVSFEKSVRIYSARRHGAFIPKNADGAKDSSKPAAIARVWMSLG
jgi:hypothetical protein